MGKNSKKINLKKSKILSWPKSSFFSVQLFFSGCSNALLSLTSFKTILLDCIVNSCHISTHFKKYQNW